MSGVMYYDRNGSLMSREEWCRRIEDTPYKQVGLDEFADVQVSTIWLGLDHSFGEGPPLIFETMVFGGPDDQWQDRYSTVGQAEAGHARVVAKQQAKWKWRRVRWTRVAIAVALIMAAIWITFI